MLLIAGTLLALGLFFGAGLMAVVTGVLTLAPATATPASNMAATAAAIDRRASAVAEQGANLQATQAALATAAANPPFGPPTSTTAAAEPEPTQPATATIVGEIVPPTAPPTAPPATAPPTSIPPPPPTPAPAFPDARQVLKALPPQNHFPAQISRGPGADKASLILRFPASDGPGVAAATISTTVEPVGWVTDDGHQLVFRFDKLSYQLAPLVLPDGTRIDAPELALDPSQPGTLRINIGSGEISRDFRWLLRVPNMQFGGRPALALADGGQTHLIEFKNTDVNVYQIKLVTDWQTQLASDAWTVAGKPLGAAPVTLAIHLDSIYTLDFNK